MVDPERKNYYGGLIIAGVESLLGRAATSMEALENFGSFDISSRRAQRFLSIIGTAEGNKFKIDPEDQIKMWVKARDELSNPKYHITFFASRAPKDPLLVPLCGLSLDGTEPQKLHLYEYVSSDLLEEGTEGSPFKETQVEPAFLVLGAVNKLLREPNRPEIIFNYTH